MYDDGMQCSGVKWNGSMECNAVEWNGMEWNGVNGCSGWMIRTPNVHEQIENAYFRFFDNFCFSRLAHFVSFREARSKIASNKRRDAKLPFFEKSFLLWFR